MPDWNHTQVSRISESREGAGDLPGHRLGADEGDLVLGDPLADRGLDRLAAEVADPGPVLDDLDLLGRLDHPLAHRVLGDVDQLGPVEGRLELGVQVEADRVVLDPEPLGVMPRWRSASRTPYW